MRDRKKAASRQDPNLLAWVTLMAALVAAVGSIWASTVATNSAHTEASITRRSDAYVTYLGDLAKFNEFLWTNSAWAGRGAPAARPADLTAFWDTASQLQANLESDYLRATIATNGGQLQQELAGIRISHQAIWLEFKCKAAIQEACPKDEKFAPATNSAIAASLTEWSTTTERAKTSFVDLAKVDLR